MDYSLYQWCSSGLQQRYIIHIKSPKNLVTRKNVIILKFEQCGFTIEYRNDYKFSDGQVLANSADPDQTAHTGAVGSGFTLYEMSHIMRKPVYVICEQQRRRSARASAQSDQRLCCSLPG